MARWRTIALMMALLAAIGVTVRITTPIGAAPADAPASTFSASRAMADIAVIGARPHPVGTAEHARVRAYLVARLRSLGLEVAVHSYPLTARGAANLAAWSGQDVSRVSVVNIAALWPGRDRHAPAAMLMAHYDTVWGSPGAADDSAGIATLLEDIRAMKAARIEPKRDIVLLMTDGEEIGLVGAQRFFDNDPLARHIGMIVNHETRGGGGRTAMFETGPGNGPAMDLFARAVPHPLANSMSVLVYRNMPNSTDLTVALAKGVAGYNLAFTGRPQLYHSPLATPIAIEPAAIQDMGDQSLGLLRALATATALPPQGEDVAFSDLLGLGTIVYSPIWGWAIIGVSMVLLLVAGSRLRAIGRLAPGDLGPGLATASFAPAIAAPMLAAANALSEGPAHSNYYDRLAALHRLEWQAALICVAAVLIGTIVRRPARRWLAALPPLATGLLTAILGGSFALALTAIPAILLALALPKQAVRPWASWLGWIILLLIIAIAVQLVAPTAAPLFEWPLMIASAAAALAALLAPGFDRPLVLIPLALLFGLALAQALAFGHFVFSGIGAPLPFVAIPFLLIAAALIRPLLGTPPRGLIVPLIGCLIAGSTVIALSVRLDPMAASVPLYSLK